MAVTYMFRLSQLCRPPSTQTPERSSDAVVGAARSNVLVSAAAQHGVGQALQHRPRACAALRGSAAGVLARDERLSHSERRTPTPVFTLPLTPVYAVYAISSLDTGVPLRPHPKATIVGMYQGVAGLAPRLFTLEEETGSHHAFMFFLGVA